MRVLLMLPTLISVGRQLLKLYADNKDELKKLLDALRGVHDVLPPAVAPSGPTRPPGVVPAPLGDDHLMNALAGLRKRLAARRAEATSVQAMQEVYGK